MAYSEKPSPSMLNGTHGWSLNAAVTDSLDDQSNRMWPTPKATDYFPGVGHYVKETDTGYSVTRKKTGQKFGAKLADAVSYEEHKIWRTPTTMDGKDDALKHATKLLQGKNKRASGEMVQVSLVDQVMIEEIKNDPDLLNNFKDHIMVTRNKLPEQQEFVKYLRSQTSVKELNDNTDIKRTTIEHWFRKDKAGFSHPSIEDWNKIKPFLKELKYDEEITSVEEIEWTGEPAIFPTPRASNGMNDSMHSVEGQLERKGYKSKLEQAVCMFPTPTARDWKGARKPETLKKKGRTETNSLPDKVRALEDRLEDHAGKPGNKTQKMLGNDPRVRNESPKTLNPAWVEWLMGFPINHTSIDEEDEVHSNVSYWDIEPNIPRVASNVNNRKDRLKCMGNAVVPQCVAAIAECIKEVEDENNF